MPPTDRRLIENWLPIKEISVEAIREGGALAGHPPVNQLHVWWARRPLVVSRSTIAAALLKADADRSQFIKTIGTTDTVVAERRKMDEIKAAGQWSTVAFSNKRAFTHNPTPAEIAWFQQNLAVPNPVILDVTAGGGSLPFEAGRLGLPMIAHELNPVATLILQATCQWPQQYGNALRTEYQQVSARFQERVQDLLQGIYPPEKPTEFEIRENKISRIVRPKRYLWGYLFGRTIKCPACQCLIILSPNWRLHPDGTGIKLLPDSAAGICSFELVDTVSQQSPGTVARGVATCPYPDCGATTPKGYLAQEAQAKRMGQQLYAINYRDEWDELTKSGKPRKKPKTRYGFRVATPEDDNTAYILSRLAEQAATWERDNILPNEPVPELNDPRPLYYGMSPWRNMFSPRQQLAHGYCVQAFRELVDMDKAAGELTELRQAAWCYIALALDKLLNRNCLLTRWVDKTQAIAGIFDSHDFGMKWSYAEMPADITGRGLRWAVEEIEECIAALTAMAGHPAPDSKPAAAAKPESQEEMLAAASIPPAPENPAAAAAQVINGDAQMLLQEDDSVDAVIFDPPYHNNVNYAELSDFFYVWLKRTAGYVLPADGLFVEQLTDKVNEAIASPARFKDLAGSPGPRATADYQAKMDRIFAECHRVLKKDRGIMVVMFTHKTTAAWHAMTLGLIESGFNITRAWPVKTEAESSLSIRDKAAARSTILLVCRPVDPEERRPQTWNRVAAEIQAAVRADDARLAELDLNIVDLYTAAYGAALQVISENWGAAREAAHPDRPEDPFGVTPADALEVARQEVAALRSEQITDGQGAQLSDPLTRFYILAQDGMGGPVMPFDEANLFARALGVELSDPATRRILENKNGKVTLKSAAARMAEGLISRERPAVTPLDQAHTAIAIAAQENAAAARQWLDFHGHIWTEGPFRAAFTALRRLQRPGHPDEPGAQALHALLYGPEPPPRQAPLPAAEG